MKTKKLGIAQSVLEFALIFPLLLVVVVGTLEIGRLVFIYVSVISASREASRYGTATGIVGNGNTNPQYSDCQGIKDAARKMSFITPILDENIQIRYDQGPDTPVTAECLVGTVPALGYVKTGTRILVNVSVPYEPMLAVVPLAATIVSSDSSRTILGSVSIGSTAAAPPTIDLTLYPQAPTRTPTKTATATTTATITQTATLAPTRTVTNTATRTVTSTATITATVTPTFTVTSTGTITHTPTITATKTVTPLHSSTPTQTIAVTPTRTPTATAKLTSTPTQTPTPHFSCSDISVSPSTIRQVDNSSEHSWTITLLNSGSFLAKLDKIQVRWNKLGNAWANLFGINVLGTSASDLFVSTINNNTGNYTYSLLTSQPANPYYIPARSGSGAGSVTLKVLFNGGNNVLPSLSSSENIVVTVQNECTITVPGN